jgi:glucosylceramidase
MLFFITLFVVVTFSCNTQQLEFWLTDPDRNILFQNQTPISPTNRSYDTNANIITLNITERYQTMDGFGYALTGGSAYHLYNLDNITRAAILDELFRTDKNNIGISYLRLSIGSSDLNEAVYSYDDLPLGEVDTNMTHFTLDIDRQYVIPVLKEILAINPQIKLLGSPWSPPVWMKTNKKSVGSNLLREYYDAYALYFVRYIQGMQAEGINIDALTIQNEPLFGGNNPSMVMHAAQEAEFIKRSLGPTFEKYSIKTKIIIYDHNPNRPDYPLEILLDEQARQYVDGSAFHMYAGRVEAL